MNKAFLRGFIKAACDYGVHPLDIIKLTKAAGSGITPTLLGALPGALAGGYMAYDRAYERQQEEPNSVNPNTAAVLGALAGGGLGGLTGSAIGSIGYERGIRDSNEQTQALMERIRSAYS